MRPGDEEVLRRYGFEPDTAYMPVPRCETCRWWMCGSLSERPDPDNRDGFCKAVTDLAPRRLEGAKAVPSYGAILTKPDFGCVQWEAKE